MENLDPENGGPGREDGGIYRVKITRRVNLGFWKGCGIIAMALLIAKLLVPSIEFNNPFSFVGLVLVIWVLNLMLKPLLIIFTLPFILFTLGAGVVLVNALVIWASTFFVPGIRLNSFWMALLSGFLIETISWIFAFAESDRFFRKVSKKRDDTIDV